ncbi:MAG: hypothetical protein EB120_09495 [Proteobacteria bacterium]|nr:hypothetical protein [Pseudomonadota bacterium]NDG27394.1 hypothetical protein [Pseudomonadota bacterium]
MDKNKNLYEAAMRQWGEMAEHYGYDKPPPENAAKAMNEILLAKDESEGLRAFQRAKEICLVSILSAWAKGRIPGPESVLNLEKRAKKAESLAKMLAEKGMDEASKGQLQRAQALRDRIKELMVDV